METDYIDMIKAHPCPPKPKIPVEVVLKTNIEGKMTPLFIKWKNGCLYEVEKVVDIKPKGPDRILYKLRINKQNCDLFYEKRKWYVNEK
ncbi:MAG: hypothetical protein MR773_04580 [Eubacterium coprostanoligenes]|nr:hypothetical protein [Eubacterium coprostanoligenes]